MSANYKISYESGKLTIEKFKPSISFKTGFSLDKMYDGQTIAPPAAADALDITGAKFEDVVLAWSATPLNAGTYTLTASIAATDNTEAAQVTLNVTISVKEVTNPTITLSENTYEYDGFLL